MRAYTMEEAAALAEACIAMSTAERPELFVLKGWHERIQTRYCLKGKTQTDGFLYERMYGCVPEKASAYLKIRYWRTGKYLPGNRGQCRMLGNALELSEEEMRFLIQGYYDRSLYICDSEEAQKDEMHVKRREYLWSLVRAYVKETSDERLMSLRIPREKAEMFLRHLYFTDAFHYISGQKEMPADMQKHIASLRYESELARQMKLRGEIPRKVFIRHLLILGMPDMTLEKLNAQLTFFGYLALDEAHTGRGGERLDWLLIQLLQMYENICEAQGKRAGLLWFQKACRTVDGIFKEAGKTGLRFMYFKALD